MRGLLFAIGACVAGLGLALGVGACGGVHYTVAANAAETRLEQARQVGAETHAPFEYYFAREHLRQAQVEAAEASYGDAASYAQTAELYAQKAIDVVKTGTRSGGGAASSPLSLSPSPSPSRSAETPSSASSPTAPPDAGSPPAPGDTK